MGLDGEPAQLTDVGCPGCRGVLAATQLGDGGHLAFSCRVGHTFGLESLLQAKEEQLEEALWTATEAFEEISMLNEEFAARIAGEASEELVAAHRRRAALAREHASKLRQVFRRDGEVPSPQDVP
jgi:two-component system, chemotaxis family, protein-glutamate methylesterase/glutaminase